MIHHVTPGFQLRTMTLQEYANVFDEALPRQNAHRTECGQLATRDTSWTGGLTSNYEAKQLITHGWYEGVKRLLALKSAVLAPETHDRRRRPKRGPEGDELDIDRALMGDWDTAWTKPVRQEMRGPATIDVVAMYGGLGWYGPDELFWAGAAASVLVDALERAGWRVALQALSVAEQHDTGKHIGVMTELKEPDMPLRTDVAAAVLCHAGVFRSHTFRARCTVPLTVDKGMGSTLGAAQVEAPLKAAGLVSDNALFITQVYSLEGCKEALAQATAKLNEGL